MERTFERATLWGVIGATCIAVVFYLVQAAGMRSFSAPATFMAEQWYFVLPLVTGFGIQAGLFRAIRDKAKNSGGTLAASGGVSTTSMAACCAHNFLPLIPVLGATGMAAFLSKHQAHIFLVSILFVAIGTTYMWRTYRKVHACCEEKTADVVS